MSAALAASGATVRTLAPRPVRTMASKAEDACAAARSAANGLRRSKRSPPVGIRHSTLAPGLTGATSRLVRLHTPPST